MVATIVRQPEVNSTNKTGQNVANGEAGSPGIVKLTGGNHKEEPQKQRKSRKEADVIFCMMVTG